MIIGITGSIGSGKTTIAKLFSRYHFNRIDADEIAHKIIDNKEIKNKIIKSFGKGILNKKNKINRKGLGDIVFNDKSKLSKLNSIMLPSIINKIKNLVKRIKNNYGADAKIVIDAPLLLETKAKNLVDKIIVVKAYKKNIIKRLNKKYPEEKIEKILKVQIPLGKKLGYADFVIDNNKDLKHLENQVKEFIKKLK